MQANSFERADIFMQKPARLLMEEQVLENYSGSGIYEAMIFVQDKN